MNDTRTTTRRAELRKEAAQAGITTTGRYVEWLEDRVMQMEAERDRSALYLDLEAAR